MRSNSYKLFHRHTIETASYPFTPLYDQMFHLRLKITNQSCQKEPMRRFYWRAVRLHGKLKFNFLF